MSFSRFDNNFNYTIDKGSDIGIWNHAFISSKDKMIVSSHYGLFCITLMPNSFIFLKGRYFKILYGFYKN